MSYDITNECIVEEFLNNWFTYDELAQYLCIDIERVRNVLEGVDNKKLSEKIEHHKNLITEYYNTVKLNSRDDDHNDVITIADYIIQNHASIRETATAFGLGKTTISDKIHEKLPRADIIKYKEVFDVLMENKSFNTNNKLVIEQVLKCYLLLKEGLSSQEICNTLGIGRNVLQRNLTTRLRKIDAEKADEVKEILKENQLDGLTPFSKK